MSISLCVCVLVALEGSVVRQLTLQPKQDSMQYRLFKKFRQVEANKKPHTLKLVSLTDVRLTQVPTPPHHTSLSRCL